MTPEEAKSVLIEAGAILTLIKIGIPEKEGPVFDLINKYGDALEVVIEAIDLMNDRLKIEDKEDGKDEEEQ